MSRCQLLKRCLVGIIGITISYSALASDTSVIRIGVQNSFGPAFYMDSFAPTMLTLRSLFPGNRFQTEQLSLDQLLQRLKERQLDLFFADSGVFSYARHQLGAIQIAARSARNADDPRYQTAMAVVVRSGSRIETLQDTLQARVISDESESVGTWLAYLSELSDRGVSRDRLLQLTEASGFTHYEFPGALTAVLAGEADVAVVPACELESQELSGVVGKGRLTVIEGAEEPSLGCRRTSPVFPGAILAATPNVSPIFLKAVTVAALSMPPSRGGDVWGIVNDFSAVESVYRKLAMGPYAYLAQRDWKSFIREYRWAFVGLAALLLGLLLHSVRAQALVRRRTEELKVAQQAEKAERERAYLMERAGIVSGLCSMLVHEVRQPLSALIAYAGGLRMLLRMKGDNHSPYAEAAENILTQARRVDEIVEHVRGYAKEKRHYGEDMTVHTLMTRAANNFKSSSASAGIQLAIAEEDCGGMMLHVEPLEAELALVNLLKNASQVTVADDAGHKQVDFAVSAEDRWVCFRIRDYGSLCTEDAVRQLASPHSSGRPEGLGIGLFLVKRIAESHGGSISFKLAEGHGVVAELRFPRIENA